MKPENEEEVFCANALTLAARLHDSPVIEMGPKDGMADVYCVDLTRVELWTDENLMLIFKPIGVEITNPTKLADEIIRATLMRRYRGKEPVCGP